ncbi:MAG TPA: aspartate aminotransferase family protein, partial [Planctomycetaceae bacterium]|nr:aspartate aminotransferase family protein [Planctomycetaceae bacterium]
LQGLRDLADEHRLVLIFDEVQTGMGRLGTWFGHQKYGVQPDIMTLAKGVAGGVACGAFIARDELSPSLRPGMHASTFGGNPLAMTAGIATMQTIEEENLLEHSQQMSERFRSHFEPLLEDLPILKELRIAGMMIGIDLTVPAGPIVKRCLERGLLVNATHDTVVRLLPPLNISAEDVDHGSEILIEELRSLATES